MSFHGDLKGNRSFVIVDARTLPKNRIIKTEVCVVGAGAAGITLARELIGQPFRVCLLESGGLELDKDTQSLYEGQNIGLPYHALDATRLRYFGGTTNHWGGACRPLDKIDFEARSWVPHSGWPFGESHLVPFYKRAQSICQLGPFSYDVETWETNATPRLPFTGDRVLTRVFQLSPATRFGKVYRDEIARAGNINTFLYANVVDVETTHNARTITRLRVATLQGNKFWVSAKLFVLATGGIENARLLLLSNKSQRAGLGNQNDLVGRFFMEHPHGYAGRILLSDPNMPTALYKEGQVVNGIRIMGVLTPSEETLRREKVVNFCVQLKTLEEASAEEEMSKGIRSSKDRFWEHLRNVISDIDDVARATYRKLLSGLRPVKILLPRIQLEQAPNPDSRVTLATERDNLNKNRVRLNWRMSDIEEHSARRGLEIIGQELGRLGLGRLRVTPDDGDTARSPLTEVNDHHIGTTRMHVNPKYGVVDQNCRVHEISNLFIAGSSVFPTAGYANPTLTIVALAVRLADHVKRLMV